MKIWYWSIWSNHRLFILIIAPQKRFVLKMIRLEMPTNPHNIPNIRIIHFWKLQSFSLNYTRDNIYGQKWPNIIPILEMLRILNYGRCIPDGALANKIPHYFEQFGFPEIRKSRIFQQTSTFFTSSAFNWHGLMRLFARNQNITLDLIFDLVLMVKSRKTAEIRFPDPSPILNWSQWKKKIWEKFF